MWSWIRKLMVGLILVGGLVAVPAVGRASTQYLVDDGLAHFNGEARGAAREALRSAYIGCLDNPIARGLTPKLQVVDVQLETGYCPVASTRDVPRYGATVRTYTLFGIPTGTVSVNCGSVDCRG